MFKPSPSSVQHDLFTSSQNLLSGKSLKIYEDQSGWHNEFRNNVTMRIDEELFRPLYSSGTNSRPNASIRVMVGMMVLKEAQGVSDEKLFEDCRFNVLTKSALGLLKVDDPVPSPSTYYLFRKQVDEHSKAGKGNLFDLLFTQISKDLCLEFGVSGQRIRMDSKLLGSNIAWLSRYELVHETLHLFYKQISKSNLLTAELRTKSAALLKMKGTKVIYTLSHQDVKARLDQLGELINSLLSLFPQEGSNAFKTLKRVFEEQFEVTESQIVLARKKEEISAKSVQSPHDTDCHYRNKPACRQGRDGNKVKGYSMNVTESCDEEKPLNLIASVDVRTASTSDVDFFQDDITKAQEVFPDTIADAHADGAYHSPENQQYCKEEGIALHLHAIQGAKGRYQLDVCENGELSVFDTRTEMPVEVTKINSKNDLIKWRIRTEKGHRYFTQKDIETALVRKQIAQTPIEILQKRNNVEATIFQIGYHYPHAKSRYRGIHRHQMWANMRCVWVNFVRILKYLRSLGKEAACFAQLTTKGSFMLAQLRYLPPLWPTNLILTLKLINSVLWNKKNELCLSIKTDF